MIYAWNIFILFDNIFIVFFIISLFVSDNWLTTILTLFLSYFTSKFDLSIQYGTLLSSQICTNSFLLKFSNGLINSQFVVNFLICGIEQSPYKPLLR